MFVVHGIVGCLQKNERDDFSNVGDIVVGRLVIDDAERFQRHFDGKGQFFKYQYGCARGFRFLLRSASYKEEYHGQVVT